MIALHYVDTMLNQGIVNVLTSKMTISEDCLNYDLALMDAKNTDVKSSAAEIEDDTLFQLVRSLVKSIRYSGCRWLVNDLLAI